MKLAVIPGDGIGPEVVAEGLKVLRGVVPGVSTTEYDLGAARWHRTGELLPDSVLRELRDHDATDATLALAEQWSLDGIAALSPLPDGPVREALTRFAQAVADRSS